MKEQSDPESQAIIAEFFSAGEKDYTPTDFITGVRETAREAKADTAMTTRIDDDVATSVAQTAAASQPEWETETTIVPDIPTRAASPQAWSTDDDKTEELGDEHKPWGSVWRTAAMVFGAAALLAVGVGVGGFLLHSHTSTPTAPADSTASAPMAAPSPAPAPPPSAAPAPPPPSTTTTEAAPVPTQGVAEMPYDSHDDWIELGNELCHELRVEGNRQNVVANIMDANKGMTEAQANAQIDAAENGYCPSITY